MNKFFVSALAAAGMMSLATASNATALTYYLMTNSLPSGNTNTYLQTDTLAYTNSSGSQPGAVPSSSTGSGLYDVFVPYKPNPAVYATPSVVTLGQDSSTAGTGKANTSATWNNVAISFEFQLDLGTSITATNHVFQVTGVMNGTIGYDGNDIAYSQASVSYNNVTDLNTGATGTLSIDPNSHNAAIKLYEMFNGVPLTIYVDQNQSKAAPGNQVGHVGYFVTTPEPGPIAMLLGMGISGGLFLRRKRA